MSGPYVVELQATARVRLRVIVRRAEDDKAACDMALEYAKADGAPWRAAQCAWALPPNNVTVIGHRPAGAADVALDRQRGGVG